MTASKRKTESLLGALALASVKAEMSYVLVVTARLMVADEGHQSSLTCGGQQGILMNSTQFGMGYALSQMLLGFCPQVKKQLNKRKRKPLKHQVGNRKKYG